jgi:xanthine dehydrogenase accessory factor
MSYSERIFLRLSTLLSTQSVVLASVLTTRGAVPRLSGSKMLITATNTEFSIGGGLAESRVIEQARNLIANNLTQAQLNIDLSGKANAAGVCGGSMHIALRLWYGEDDLKRACSFAKELSSGRSVILEESDLGCTSFNEEIKPNPRLLIIGAGHCGLALYELASFLEFDIWIFDQRAHCFAGDSFAHATCLSGDYANLGSAFKTQRDMYVVLLNRDFHADVESLKQLSSSESIAFLGMMGSRKRITQVFNALPHRQTQLTSITAPVGIEIQAQTPHEIAVSVLAQLIQHRANITRN